MASGTVFYTVLDAFLGDYTCLHTLSGSGLGLLRLWLPLSIFKSTNRQIPRLWGLSVQSRFDWCHVKTSLIEAVLQTIWQRGHSVHHTRTTIQGLFVFVLEPEWRISWGAVVTCLRAVSSLRGAHIRNCPSCAQAPLIGISWIRLLDKLEWSAGYPRMVYTMPPLSNALKYTFLKSSHGICQI